jgi:hypothetical protein
MLEKVKLALRIKSTAYDAEIQALISTCKIDLSLAGVLDSKLDTVESDEVDPLIENAIILYCKANFGYDESAPRFADVYLKQKIAMSLSVEYGGEANV